MVFDIKIGLRFGIANYIDTHLNMKLPTITYMIQTNHLTLNKY